MNEGGRRYGARPERQLLPLGTSYPNGLVNRDRSSDLFNQGCTGVGPIGVCTVGSAKAAAVVGYIVVDAGNVRRNIELASGVRVANTVKGLGCNRDRTLTQETTCHCERNAA